jgi:hypothetical protein
MAGVAIGGASFGSSVLGWLKDGVVAAGQGARQQARNAVPSFTRSGTLSLRAKFNSKKRSNLEPDNQTPGSSGGGTDKKTGNPLGDTAEFAQASSGYAPRGTTPWGSAIAAGFVPSNAKTLTGAAGFGISTVTGAFFFLISITFLFLPFIGRVIKLLVKLQDRLREFDRAQRTKLRELREKEGVTPALVIRYALYILFSFLIVVLMMAIEILRQFWAFKWVLLILYVLYLITYSISIQLSMVTGTATEVYMALSEIYNYALAGPGNLILDIYEISNPLFNSSLDIFYQWVMLFVEFFSGRDLNIGFRVAEEPVFSRPGRTLEENQILDLQGSLGVWIRPAIGFLVYLRQLFFTLQFEVVRFSLYYLYDALVFIAESIVNLFLKLLCIVVNPLCFFLEVLELLFFLIPSLRTIRLFLLAFGVSLVFACPANVFNQEEDCRCGGQLWDLTSPGIYSKLPQCETGFRRLIECNIESDGQFVETVDNIVKHSDTRREFACPLSFQALNDDVVSSELMHKHGYDGSFDVCVVNQNLRIEHDPWGFKDVTNMGKCDHKRKNLFKEVFSNHTLPKIVPKRKLNDKKHLGHKTREEVVQDLIKEIGSEKFFMGTHWECDLSNKTYTTPWHTAYDMACIVYAVYQHADKLGYFAEDEYRHTTRFYRHTRGRKLVEASSMEELFSKFEVFSHASRIYQAHANEGKENPLFDMIDSIRGNDHKNHQPAVYEAMMRRHQDLSKRNKKEKGEVKTNRRNLQESNPTAPCNGECTEEQICCYNNFECVTDRTQCTHPVQMGVVEFIKFKIQELEETVENFDFIAFIDSKECRKIYEEDPETDMLSEEVLRYLPYQPEKYVSCFPRQPPIVERFPLWDVSREQNALVTDCGEASCDCPFFYDVTQNVIDEGDVYTEVPVFSWKVIVNGFVWIGYSLFLVLPGFLAGLNWIWISCAVYIGANTSIVPLDPLQSTLQTVQYCLIVHMPEFIFLCIYFILVYFAVAALSIFLEWILDLVAPNLLDRNRLRVIRGLKPRPDVDSIIG